MEFKSRFSYYYQPFTPIEEGNVQLRQQVSVLTNQVAHTGPHPSTLTLTSKDIMAKMYRNGGVSDGVYKIFMFMEGLGYGEAKKNWDRDYGPHMRTIPETCSNALNITQFIENHYLANPNDHKTIFVAKDRDQLMVMDEMFILI